MDAVLLGGARWLHLVATVVLIGYYVLLGLVFLPILTQNLKGPDLGTILAGMNERPRPLVIGSILIFIITGVYLMGVDENYVGIGDFSNTWSIVMLVKHIVVLVMIVVGVYMSRITMPQAVAALQAGTEPSGAGAATQRLSFIVNLMLLLGIVVLLLTAVAEMV